MYTQIWNKYLPIIKILMKRSINGDQKLDMNLTDFERAGVSPKSSNKFIIKFVNSRVENIISSSAMATELAAILQQDSVVKDLLSRNDYHITMSGKFQLGIKFLAREEELEEATMEAAEAVA